MLSKIIKRYKRFYYKIIKKNFNYYFNLECLNLRSFTELFKNDRNEVRKEMTAEYHSKFSPELIREGNSVIKSGLTISDY